MRIWTVEEANAALPRVDALVKHIRELITAARAESGRARRNGHGSARPRDAELRAALRELDDDGIVLRDPDRGLVDFHAVSTSGRPYLLCWLLGEPEVAWWHWPEAGFAGRTPLAEPPE